MTHNELKARLHEEVLLLSIPGIGRGRYHKLTRQFGTPGRVLSATTTELERVGGISKKISEAIRTEQDDKKTRELVEEVFQQNWQVLFCDQDSFPHTLKHISENDLPPFLFISGQPLSVSAKRIGIVGSRHATERGKQFAYKLAFALAQTGVEVVSGMAEGIDAYAHQGALDAGGKTIAVWGSSLDIVYPPTHTELAENIRTHGTLVSEYLPGTKPDRPHFPERNRIISGLSDGVVVVEAGKKSGALITAAEALKQGRELFAVPGPPEAIMSSGTNDLLKKGARLVTSVEDIFEELPRLKGAVISRQFMQMPDLTETERKIVDLVQNGPQQVDKISRITNLPVSELMEFLLALEMKGIVREMSGKRFALADES